jgi:hypothetical protein
MMIPIELMCEDYHNFTDRKNKKRALGGNYEIQKNCFC